MRHVPPSGDNTLSSPVGERAADDIDRADTPPRRVLERDGLHPGPVAQPARDVLRDKGLLALMSSARHEVRSPLQSIQGFAELLAAESYGRLSEEQRVFVEHIMQSGMDLSRAVDACFDLVQAEFLHPTLESGRTPLRRGLEEALSAAESHGPRPTFDVDLNALPPELAVAADETSLTRAVGAIVTTLAPLTRGKLCITGTARNGSVELLFGAVGDARIVWRSLSELARRSPSARAMLWLRLAAALLQRAGGRLETAEGYDRVRVTLPVRELA